MRRRRVALALTFTVAAALAACEAAPEEDRRGRQAPDAAAEAATVDAEIEAEDDAGVLPLTELADTPCERPAMISTTVHPPSAELVTPTALVASGPRRAGLLGGGVMTFGAEGAGASARIGSPVYGALASMSPFFAAVGTPTEALSLTRLTPTGAALGPPVIISSDLPSGYGAGAGAGAALVVWATGRGALYGRGVSNDGAVTGEAFFLRGLGETEDVQVNVAGSATGELGVAFSGGYRGALYRLGFARATATELLGRSHTLLAGADFLRLQQMVQTSNGYALLFQRAGGAHVLMLDASGHARGPVVRLAGSLRGYALATDGKDVAALATKQVPLAGGDAGEPGDAGDAGDDAASDASLPAPRPANVALALRVLDGDGNARGPWQCLEDAHPVEVDVGGAALGDAEAWTALHRTASGAVVVTRMPR